MNSQLDYMKELKLHVVPNMKNVQSKLQEDIDYLNNNLSSLDEDAQREVKRKIQDLTIRIIYLQSDNLKKVWIVI